MKNLPSLLLLILTFSSSLFSQSFVEHAGDGWGPGLGDCRPVTIDLDSDGLLDLLIGNYGGYVSHFEQTATNSNEFSVLTHRLNNIHVGLFASPAVADMDKDGLLDLLIGEWEGNLHHYEQISVNADSFLLVTEDFDSIRVEANASPHFTDLDQDGLLDLLIGSQSGNLFLYEQESDSSEEFVLVTDSLGIDPPTFRTNPAVIDLDQNDLLDLLVGGNFGDLSHFEQTEPGSVDFTVRSLHLFDDPKLMYGGSAPCLDDFDSDGLFDLIVGEMDGLYYHFEQSAAQSFDFILRSQNFFQLLDVGTGAAPRLTDLDDDGLWDLIVGEWQGNLNHYEQSEAGSLRFDLLSDTLGNLNDGEYSIPAFTDLDADGRLDLIVGVRDGTLLHLEQDSENLNHFNLITENFSGIDLERYAAPCFTDLDSDGLIDMIIGENVGKLHLYEQQSLHSSEFVLITDSLNVLVNEYQPTPYVLDFDDDGLLDLFVGEGNGKIKHYEQQEANSMEFEMESDYFGEINVGKDARIGMGDINQDGLLDLICGDNEGGLHLFINNTGEETGTDMLLPAQPDGFDLSGNYPNPFWKKTEIEYQIPVQCDVSITVYNMQGQIIKTLVNGNSPAGRHIIQWDASDQNGNLIRSGGYILQMKAGAVTKSIFMTFIK